MCELLSKPSFNDIKSTDLCGSGKTKISKQYLFETVKDLTNDIQRLNQLINPVFECKTLSEMLDDICNSETPKSDQIMSDINKQLLNNSGKLTSVETQLNQLSDLVNKFQTPTLSSSEEKVKPKTPTPSVIVPEREVLDYKDEFLTIEEEQKLTDFLANTEFSDENGHSVKNYGADYKYSGAAERVGGTMPDEIQSVIAKVKSVYPEAKINQCLVNRYEGSTSKLSEHSDDELCIDPNSTIITVSIGQERTIRFRNKFSSDISLLPAKPRSVYVMTRSSQSYYTHRIDEESDATLRYSLTFRMIGDQFRRSTLIIGDSNSTGFVFGEGKGTFGRGQPGERVKASTVENINPHDCAGYANVVFMVGTNNLREGYVSGVKDVKHVLDILEDKICIIRRITKDIRIVLLPVLPTCLPGMNRSIQLYNAMMYDRFISSGCYLNILMPAMCEIGIFFDRDMLLKRHFARDGKDPIHLNVKGIAHIVRVIKRQVFKSRSFITGKPFSIVAGAGRGVGGST